MRNGLRFGWIFFALAALVMVAACGSEDPQQDDNPPSLAVAQEDTEPIDAAKAELLYREALSRVQLREVETGEYFYNVEEIELVERALEIRPGYLDALEVLAWAYSTYPVYAGNDAFHETALEYAQELFRVRGEANEYSYQLLGAAMYSNGQQEVGDRYFDKAIDSAPNEFLEQTFRRDKEYLRELHAPLPTQPPNSR